jgi:hypothetical protein
MKSVGQIIDELDKRIEHYTECVLNPARNPAFREEDLQRRDELVNVRKFITTESANA